MLVWFFSNLIVAAHFSTGWAIPCLCALELELSLTSLQAAKSGWENFILQNLQ